MLTRIYRLLGIDNALAITLSGRGLGIFFGLGTLWLVSSFLDRSSSGYYFTFLSILGAQAILELGMFQVIMQFASHEMPKLSFNKDGILVGNNASISRLSSILRLAFKWYAVVAFLLVVIVYPIGFMAFSSAHDSLIISWKIPWAILVISAGINVFIMPIYSFLEGCGKIAHVARVRVVQNIIGSLIAWAVLSSGGGLYALPSMNVAYALVALFWLTLYQKSFLINIFHAYRSVFSFEWKKDIFPYQWRIAATTLTGYISNQVLVPIVFILAGPTQAGQLGLSLALTWALLSISVSWIQTKAPLFGSLIAQERYLDVDKLFLPALFISTLVTLVGCLFIIFIKLALQYFHSPLGDRLLEIYPLTILLATTILNNIIFCVSIYLRADKKEPLLPMWLILATLVLGASLLITPQFGQNGVVVIYFLCTFFIALPWTLIVFYKVRRSRLSGNVIFRKPLKKAIKESSRQ